MRSALKVMTLLPFDGWETYRARTPPGTNKCGNNEKSIKSLRLQSVSFMFIKQVNKVITFMLFVCEWFGTCYYQGGGRRSYRIEVVVYPHAPG